MLDESHCFMGIHGVMGATTKPDKARIETLESRVLRTILFERRWDIADLARAMGVHYRALANEFHTDFPQRKMRFRIEDFFKREIWNHEPSYAIRAPLIERFGFDPYLAPRKELRAYLKRRHTPGCVSVWNRETLLQKLLETEP